jgi:hypothetical protein
MSRPRVYRFSQLRLKWGIPKKGLARGGLSEEIDVQLRLEADTALIAG